MRLDHRGELASCMLLLLEEWTRVVNTRSGWSLNDLDICGFNTCPRLTVMELIKRNAWDESTGAIQRCELDHEYLLAATRVPCF